jgi:Carboxypeptidase regulatory-like domain/TonB dependent receptor
MRASRIRLYVIVSLCLAFWAGSCTLFAQGGSEGTITGNVTDPTGAPIPGAAITIRNINTNDTRSMKTGSTGVFSVTSLPVGTYEMKVTATGFQALEVQDIKLDVSATRRIDAHMTIGQLSETVSVEASAPLLNTDNAISGQVIESKRVTELPLNGRNFQQLQLLTPGSIATNNYQTSQGLGGGASSLTTNSTMNISDGGRPGQVLFLVDGANASNQNGRGLIQQPAIDEIQEFSVQSSNMSAEFGYGSSAVLVSIKSGTNVLHGAAWEFLRNDTMDARSFFATGIEPLKRNQFGANAGGPVMIPKLYRGRDKTFWFVSYEGLRLRQGQTSAATVPTAQMRTGNLSQFSNLLFDPATTRPDPTTPGGYIRDPFPGNIIPGNRINPIASFFLDPAWIPLPNQNALTANLRRQVSVPTDSNQATIKLDHHFSNSDTLLGRFSFTRANEGSLGPYNGLNQYDPGANPKHPNGYNSVVSWNHIFSPTNLLETRFTFSRAKVLFDTPNFGTIDYTTQLGIQGFGHGISDVYPSYPVMSISGMTGLPQGFLLNYTSNNFEYTANYTMIRGRHTFKMGETWRAWQQNLTTSGQGSGTFSFNGSYTNNPANPSNTGQGLADFLLGIPNSASRYVPPGWYYQRFKNEWAFFNDDWKPTQNLTVNLGVRYEINWPTTEKYLRFANFSPTARNGLGAIVVPNQASVSAPYLQSSVPLSYPFYQQFTVFAKDAGINEKYLRDVGYNHFAPRLGIAYRLPRNTVIRTGYGLYWVQLDGNRESEFESVPFLIRESGILNDSFIPTHTIQNFLPAGSSFSQYASLLAHDPAAKDFGYSQQWNFAIQHQFGGAFSAEIAYVGTKGTRLQTSRGINVPLPGPGNVQARRPYPDFGYITWNEQSASSIYHALQTKLERRFSKGLSLLASFTWSKSIDQDSDNTEGAYDPYNFRLNRGLSSFDVPRVFTAGLVYELPWLRKAHGIAGLAGGWTAGSVLTFQDGFPYTPGYSGDPSNTGTSSRADVVAGCDPSISNPTPQRWFNTACFVAPPGPPMYRRGNAGRHILRGDAYRNVDLSLYKSFAFTERAHLQLRFEGFNALNEHSFAFPNATVNSAAYGQVSSSSAGRVLQVAGKFVF